MFVLVLANVIKPMVVFAYCDGKRYKPLFLFLFIAMASDIKPMVFFCLLRWQRYNTNVSSLIAMANAIKPLLFKYCAPIGMANAIKPMLLNYCALIAMANAMMPARGPQTVFFASNASQNTLLLAPFSRPFNT